MQGIKSLMIHAHTRYPVVSAYEFEFLKTEREIQDLLKPCTVYFILQRSLIYINNFTTEDGVIKFQIDDDTSTSPIDCSFVPSDNGMQTPGDKIFIEAQFYKATPDYTQPFNGMAGFKLYAEENQFLGWFSPQKFIYEVLSGNIEADISGDIRAYLDYTVHYIGKSFSQDIWERLTGHEKMQRILTVEDSLNTQALKSPFEICLLMLDIDGFDENTIYPTFDFAVPEGHTPIVYDLNTAADFEKFLTPNLAPRSEALTTEVEAMLINKFKPEYNSILFNNYPYIQNGTRDSGYTFSRLIIEKMPAILMTEHHTQNVVIPTTNL